jgi:acyl carrier protein
VNDEELTDQILEILGEEFQIINPLPDESLHEKYDFTDIDTLELIDCLEIRNGWIILMNHCVELMEFDNINDLSKRILQIIQNQ